jgi:murein DD-endopeptidase MepM/ murein hydrolase activator NlpD
MATAKCPRWESCPVGLTLGLGPEIIRTLRPHLPILIAVGLALGGNARAERRSQEPPAPASVPFDEEGDAFEPESSSPLDALPEEHEEEAEAPKPAAKAKSSAPRRASTRSEPADVARPAQPSQPARASFDLTKLAASPVPGAESSGFGWRDDPINNRRKFHKGTDFRAPKGTSVFAAGTGLVTYAGRMGGYGNVIFLDHGDGVVTRYGHLKKIGVTKGATVSGGAQIGEVGATGRATGPHLHFEVRLDGRAVNPTVAMSVADLQRTNPAAALAAAAALAPEVQAASIDPHPRPSRGKREHRPERAGRAKRTQVLW